MVHWLWVVTATSEPFYLILYFYCSVYCSITPFISCSFLAHYHFALMKIEIDTHRLEMLLLSDRKISEIFEIFFTTMAYPESLKKRAIELSKDYSAEQIADIFSKEVNKWKLKRMPDARTIRNWLSEEKKQEQLEPFIIEAKKEHFAIVRNDIKHWWKSINPASNIDIVLYRPGAPTSGEEWRMDAFDESWIDFNPDIQRRLKGHLSFNTELWQNHEDWINRLVEYENKCRAIRDTIHREGVGWHVKVGEDFERPLIVKISFIQDELDIPGAWQHAEPQLRCEGQKLIAEYPNKRWEILEAEKPAHYRSSYEEMSTRFLEGKTVENLLSVYKEVNRLTTKISRSLSDILSRGDYIWGTCPLCPTKPSSTY